MILFSLKGLHITDFSLSLVLIAVHDTNLKEEFDILGKDRRSFKKMFDLHPHSKTFD